MRSELEGGASSVNHMEQMALDFGTLLATTVPELAHRADRLRLPRFLDRMRAGAREVWEHFGHEVFDLARSWKSDTARGWAAFAVPLTDDSLESQLGLARAFADDPHFAVREWAWLGVRPSVTSQTAESVRILAEWVTSDSPRIRRFSCEVLRPRGVWSAHIPLLKSTPSLALPVLDPLLTDSHRYVRDSVGNWLNDISKHDEPWLRSQIQRWRRQHGDRIDYVVRRASRTLERRGTCAAS